ncbi:hypothetical protein ACFFHM_24510 [Halalkalibacter kiskunsagensis]|uniref:Uncharacterized protein n=1 Tax=Halalkalibacter kiskunsagensis TaxID=1548599 RepID=A0ABV6KP43_9BACI
MLEALNDSLEKSHRISLRAGISRKQKDPSKLQISYHEAKQAAKCKKLTEQVVAYDSLLLEIALSEVQLQQERKS